MLQRPASPSLAGSLGGTDPAEDGSSATTSTATSGNISATAPATSTSESTPTPAPGRAYLIDFDWAGKEGEVCYPLTISLDVKWPRPASERIGQPITKRHDS